MEREKKIRERRKETKKNRQGCGNNLHSLRVIDWCVRLLVCPPCSAGTSRTSRTKCGHNSAISNRLRDNMSAEQIKVKQV